MEFLKKIYNIIRSGLKKYFFIFTRRSSRGFTLIETLIYSALTSIIIGSILLLTYQIIGNSSALNKRIVIDEEANFLIRKIEWALIGNPTINFPVSGASSTSISISKINNPSNPIIFDLSSGFLRIKKGTGDLIALNSQNITVSNLVFYHIAAIGESPESIKANFNVNQRPYQITINLKK